MNVRQQELNGRLVGFQLVRIYRIWLRVLKAVLADQRGNQFFIGLPGIVRDGSSVSPRKSILEDELYPQLETARAALAEDRVGGRDIGCVGDGAKSAG